MTSAVIRLVARAIAIAIAIAALIDPVFSMSQRPRPAFAVVFATTNGDNVIGRFLSRAAEWDVVGRYLNGSRLPCARDERCVIVADGSLDVDMPADLQHPPLLVIDRPATPSIELGRVEVSSSHGAAAGAMRVELIRKGPISSTDVRVTDGDAVVGSATHMWQSETNAVVDVPWWPLAIGVRRLHVKAVASAGKIIDSESNVDVAVDVTNKRGSILIFDARPSWSSTFVRRALEDDPRFVVGHRARVAPALTVGTAAARLDEPVLDATDVAVIGGPDALTASDVTLLARFVRVRGGTLILLPEQRASGPLQQLMPGAWSEHLTQSPERIGALYATEILRGPESSLDTVLARSGSQAAIVSTPAGNGRIAISGAMDAWRHREKDADAFDRFWRSVAAEGSAAASTPSITFAQALTQSDAKASFTVRDRRMTLPANATASATMRCDGGTARAIRLRPTGTIGEFAGDADATGASCVIDANINDRQASASFASADRPQRVTNVVLAKLERAVRASGGAVITDEEAALQRALAAEGASSSQLVSVYPMRAPWWIFPFAGYLTTEWWLRRRKGLR